MTATRIALCALLVAIAAPAAAQKVELFPQPPAPKPADRITFSHKKHLAQDIECTDCHEDVSDATSLDKLKKPKMDFCSNCHDQTSDADKCGMCHSNADDPSAVWAPLTKDLHFDHKAHLAIKGVTCVSCHPKAKTSTDAYEDLFPTMQTCTKCHEKQIARLDCQKCHTRLPQLGVKPLGTAVHGPGFFPIHGAWAKGSSTLCSTCHEQTFCSDCHSRTTPVRASIQMPDRVDRNFVHRGDWLGRHALEAKARPAYCLSCHGQTFCSDCHNQSRALSPTTVPTSPHPPGYVRRGGVAFHGDDARMHIEQCAACHDQGAASICVKCHKVGGPGGDPHPPGFGSTRKDAIHRSATCVPCHGVGG